MLTVVFGFLFLFRLFLREHILECNKLYFKQLLEYMSQKGTLIGVVADGVAYRGIRLR